MTWFMNYYHALEQSNLKETRTQELIQSIKQNNNIETALEKAREVCKPEEFLEFTLIAMLKSLDVTKFGISSCQTQFESVL